MNATHPPTPCCGYAGPMTITHPICWNPYNDVVQCHNCGHVYSPAPTTDAIEETGYWKTRALCAEDLIECIQTWHEVMPHRRRLEQIQSAVVVLRRTSNRADTPTVCGELMPLCPDDSWTPMSERRPTLTTPIVEVLFDTGEILESKFWVGYYAHDFLHFDATRPDSVVTHWRPKQEEP